MTELDALEILRVRGLTSGRLDPSSPGYDRAFAMEAAWSIVANREWRVRLRAAPGRPPDPVSRESRGRELVVARYNEDLAWLAGIPAGVAVTVYNKGPELGPLPRPATVIPRPNVAREAETWLAHIIRNYDCLAERTFFVQGTPHADRLADRLLVDWPDSVGLSLEYKPDWPGGDVRSLDLVEEVMGFPVRYGNADRYGDYAPDLNRPWLDRVWLHLFARPRPDPVHYAYGAEYCVPAARIRGRSLAFWRWLHSEAIKPGWQLTSPVHGSVSSGWALEATWLYLFGDAATYPVRCHANPEIGARLAAAARARACPDRTGEGCGCGESRCAKGRGRAGIVVLDDCLACPQTSPP